MIRKNSTNLVLSVIFLFLSSWICLAMAQNKASIPVNVGVVLNLNRLYGKIWLSCIKIALSDFYASHAHYKTRLVLNIRNSKENVVGAAAAGSPPYHWHSLDLIKYAQVQAILGPVTSM
ncbi:hypothetical protein RchiOBHm_Chr6g0269901 [Rosa chinensis]|uniref:Periplasmic binding protein-like I n=1 Tax=Rosa chinensis TaxID=74649 RepID=A0A2P6PQM8_ROSCH|nr:hypothetical protein RchiOBHm_Chr6g0269901 [Rosa chinensis]